MQVFAMRNMPTLLNKNLLSSVKSATPLKSGCMIQWTSKDLFPKVNTQLLIFQISRQRLMALPRLRALLYTNLNLRLRLRERSRREKTPNRISLLKRIRIKRSLLSRWKLTKGVRQSQWRLMPEDVKCCLITNIVFFLSTCFPTKTLFYIGLCSLLRQSSTRHTAHSYLTFLSDYF